MSTPRAVLAAVALTAATVLTASGATATTVVTESEIVEAFLERDAPDRRHALETARRDAAARARAWAPAWRVEALREESLSDATAYSTDVLGVGVELAISGEANALERDRAAAERAGDDLALFSQTVRAVSDLRALLVEAWRAEREATILAAGSRRVEDAAADLARLVESGEHAPFDLDRLRALADTSALRSATGAARARSARAQLEALVERELGTLQLGEPDALPTGDDLVGRTLATHPELRRLRQRVEAGRLAAELASRSHPGLLDLRAGYRRDDAPGLPTGDGYEVGIAYTLPQRSLRESEAAQARAELAARELDLARAERRIRAAVAHAAARLEAVRELTHELDAGQDQGAGETRLEAIRSGALRRYRAGESTLAELVDVLVGIEEHELLALEGQAARHEARIALDRATALATAPELARLVEDVTPSGAAAAP